MSTTTKSNFLPTLCKKTGSFIHCLKLFRFTWGTQSMLASPENWELRQTSGRIWPHDKLYSGSLGQCQGMNFSGYGEIVTSPLFPHADCALASKSLHGYYYMLLQTIQTVKQVSLIIKLNIVRIVLHIETYPLSKLMFDVGFQLVLDKQGIYFASPTLSSYYFMHSPAFNSIRPSLRWWFQSYLSQFQGLVFYVLCVCVSISAKDGKIKIC